MKGCGRTSDGALPYARTIFSEGPGKRFTGKCINHNIAGQWLIIKSRIA
jgi:hypothetical protein